MGNNDNDFEKNEYQLRGIIRLLLALRGDGALCMKNSNTEVFAWDRVVFLKNRENCTFLFCGL